ncbi:MAG: DinB family protein [Chloroflexi bacterium]|nr:DinB family protein [Chloroflexota bacterium]
MSIRPFYDRWPQYNRRLTEVIGAMTDKQLAIRPAPQHWPIWATVGHTAGGRAYWLCGVLGEPGAEATPFPDPLNAEGWEDDLDHPRSADELVAALDTTWAVADRLLDRWTPEMLNEEVERLYGDQRQVHSRASILQRLITHEAYHCGELSQTLGIAGLPQIDLWWPDEV